MDILFDLQETYILEDNCILLRPLTAEDCDNLLPFSLNEPDLWQFSLVKVAGEENLKSYINDAIHDRAAGKTYAFIVFDKRSQEYAGSTRFYDIQISQKTIQLG